MWKIYLLPVLFMVLPVSVVNAQVTGCNDPLATNYNPLATINNGSCAYATATTNVTFRGTLNDTLKETSGLVYWDGLLWTHNDDADTLLYGIDTTDGHIVKRVALVNAANHDWEEITQDQSYFYLGDFGNNGNGNRQNLAILRIAKAALMRNQPSVTPDKIFFNYQDQTDFSGTGANNTDFDCEAFIAGTDSLYLFTKQWVGRKTKVYALPKLPGTYTAVPGAEWNVDGLVTGATFIPAKKAVALVGYKISTSMFQPFVYLLYDFTGTQFFACNKRKINLNALLHQTEAIATNGGSHFFISNEALSNSAVRIDAKLMSLDLSAYLNPYYQSLAINSPFINDEALSVYPNPTAGDLFLTVKMQQAGAARVKLFNGVGQELGAAVYNIPAGKQELHFKPLSQVPAGIYWLEVSMNGQARFVKVVYR